ncbi:MAG: RSP_2648 family PIN domain-containing protein [Paracoccaceae bacterium]
MRAVLDTCVLYPTVMREVLLGVARAGMFTPQWSTRIIEEWTRAARKLGPEGAAQAQAEAAMVQAAWPAAAVQYGSGLEARLWLPDPADTHVLAAAIAGSADVIVTMNAKDFPANILAEEGLSRIAPDEFLLGFWQVNPDAVARVAESVRQEAQRLSGQPWEMRKLMKKARLPRLGKALSA